MQLQEMQLHYNSYLNTTKSFSYIYVLHSSNPVHQESAHLSPRRNKHGEKISVMVASYTCEEGVHLLVLRILGN